MSGENTISKQWERCLEYFQCNMSAQEYQTWFLPITFVAFDAATKELLLSVPSNFFFEMLDGQYKRLVYNVVWRVYGKDARITYRIQMDSTNDTTVDVEASGSAVPKMAKGRDDVFKAKAPKSRDNELDSQLNQEYRFDNFIEGECNKLPRSVGQSIADNPAQVTFNPLFLYGPSGVGKTHLVNAIGTAIKEKTPHRRVLYVGAHQFTVQYSDATVNNHRNEFIQFYQTIDTLIIDDIQELAGQAKTQLAFFHIFNHLRMNGKQIILTSDRPPTTMQGMEERLLTRFKWGLMAELEKPNKELCRKILVNKIRHDGLVIPDDVVDYIAQNVNESVRDLEGIVNSLMAHAVVYNADIDLEMAQQIIRRVVRFQSRDITLDSILEACCQTWKVSQEEVFSKSRKAGIVTVRQTVMYLAHKYMKLTTNRIGMLVGGRNHATVLHAIKQVRDHLATDSEYAKCVADIESGLRTGK